MEISNTTVREGETLVAKCNSENSNPPAESFVFYIDDVPVKNEVGFYQIIFVITTNFVYNHLI